MPYQPPLFQKNITLPLPPLIPFHSLLVWCTDLVVKGKPKEICDHPIPFDPSVMDFGPRARKTAQNYVAYRAQNRMGSIQTSPPSSPQHFNGLHQSPPPTSRTRAIAQGQKELMEMVRNMPETYYELSLRDLVEKPAESLDDGSSGKRRNIDDPNEEKALDRSESWKKMQNGMQSYLSGKAPLAMTGRMDHGGFLLKLVFPGSSLGSKQKQQSSSSVAVNGSSKVSSRTSLSDEPAKGLDKEWWKKFSASNKVKDGILEVDPASVKNSTSSNTKNGKNRR